MFQFAVKGVSMVAVLILIFVIARLVGLPSTALFLASVMEKGIVLMKIIWTFVPIVAIILRYFIPQYDFCCFN